MHSLLESEANVNFRECFSAQEMPFLNLHCCISIITVLRSFLEIVDNFFTMCLSLHVFFHNFSFLMHTLPRLSWVMKDL